tara:strand:+ start:179 stop:691 length:513 start_codon:yes stop_codon:yes gene_type:complete
MHDGDVFKIGQTFRAVEDRVRELDRETGNPGKFKVLASFPVSDRHKAEAACFAELEQQGYSRINESEFVKGPWEKILAAVEKGIARYDVKPVVNPPAGVDMSLIVEKYVGEYRDDKQHGQGTYTFGPSSQWAGEKYVGEYRNGKRNGQGTFTFADGNKYVGEFRDGKPVK